MALSTFGERLLQISSEFDEGGEKDILFDLATTSPRGSTGTGSRARRELIKAGSRRKRDRLRLFKPPGVETPGAPDVQAPGAPDVSAPGTPDVSAPGAPDVTTPDISAPETPDVSVPDVGIPTPDQVTPDIDFNTPDIEPIEVTAPDVPIPDPTVPDVSFDFQEPEIETPDVFTPDVAVPEELEEVVPGVSTEEGFGKVETGTGVQLDFRDNIEDAFSDVTEGTSFEDVAAEDVYNAVKDPNELIENAAEEKTKELILTTTDMDEDLLDDLVKFAEDPEKFAIEKGLEKVGDFIGDKINLPGAEGGGGPIGSAGAAALKELIDGGNIEDAANAAAEALAYEMVFAAADAAIPGAGTALRLYMGLGGKEKVDELAAEVVPTDFEELVESEPVAVATDVIGAVGDVISDVGGFFSGKSRGDIRDETIQGFRDEGLENEFAVRHEQKAEMQQLNDTVNKLRAGELSAEEGYQQLSNLGYKPEDFGYNRGQFNDQDLRERLEYFNETRGAAINQRIDELTTANTGLPEQQEVIGTTVNEFPEGLDISNIQLPAGFDLSNLILPVSGSSSLIFPVSGTSNLIFPV